jgi:hypothetical protein
MFVAPVKENMVLQHDNFYTILIVKDAGQQTQATTTLNSSHIQACLLSHY